MPKVSVVIPVYGVEKYIERCVRNLFEQSLDDIEYLFIDDCTPDKSIEKLNKILEEYPFRKPQVIIHKMEKNSGQAIVRKWGMEHATGDFLIHCDSDDCPSKYQYEKMYSAAMDQKADLVFCDYNRIYPDGKKTYIKRLYLNEKKDQLLLRMLGGYHGLNQLWGCMMKRNLIKSIIYPPGNQGEDRVIMFQAVYYSSKVAYVEEPLYSYFINSTSIQHSFDPEKLLERSKHSTENVRVLFDFLNKVNMMHLCTNQEVTVCKFEPRTILAPGLYDIRCREEWYKIFPEINNDVYLNKYISISSKLKELIMRLHLGVVYGFIYRLFKM